MIEPINLLIPSFFAGMVFGAIYFGGLWFSVRHLLVLQHAAAWLLLSFLVRTSIVLPGFYWTMDGHWDRLVMALLGFSLVRLGLSSRVGRKLRSGG